MSTKWFHKPKQGFTLIEVVFAMVITMIMGLSTIGAIVYTRQSMELDKQRISALNYCRDYMEQAHSHINVSWNQVPLVDFDTPTSSPDLMADVTVEYFPILENATGTVDFDNPTTMPDAIDPFYCRVSVTWTPPGSWSRPQCVRMASVVRRSL